MLCQYWSTGSCLFLLSLFRFSRSILFIYRWSDRVCELVFNSVHNNTCILNLNSYFVFPFFNFYFPALLEFFFAKSTAPMVLQIIYVNGATVRTGVEIEGSVVVRMLKYGDVVESFQRLKTKEGTAQMFMLNFCRLVLGRERAFFFITLILILTQAGTLTETIPLILY